MNRFAILCLLALLRSLMPNSATPGQGTDRRQESTGGTIVIALSGLNVTDKTVELRYTISNHSDHDAWVCDGMREHNRVRPADYEAYVDKDGRTIVIRKQIGVPKQILTTVPRAYEGRYVLLHPAQERTWSLSLGLPMARSLMLASPGPDTDATTRLVLRVGLFDGDLPGKIRGILEIAGKLQCTRLAYTDIGAGNLDTYQRYFRGLHLSDVFGGLSGFDASWKEASEDMVIPHDWPPLLDDECCLEISVAGVLIPLVH